MTRQTSPRSRCVLPPADDELHLGHFGRLYGPRIDVGGALNGLARSGRWRRVVVHQFGEVERDRLDALAEEVQVIIQPARPWREIQQAAAGLSAVLVVGNLSPAQLPSKVIDYLTLPAPRIALVRDGGADAIADYLRDKSGWLVAAADSPELAGQDQRPPRSPVDQCRPHPPVRRGVADCRRGRRDFCRRVFRPLTITRMNATMAHPGELERRLIQLLCATECHRHECRDEIAELMARIDPRRLVNLLKRINLLVLIGQRLLATGLGDVPEVERELESFYGQARRWGTATELVSLEVLDTLNKAGIRALSLKGSVLARDLHGDVATRSSIDVDVLVAPADLRDAVAAVAELGWRWEPGVRRVGGLPTLHETLVHPTLPRIELHWRVHWYERQFAAEALERAQRPASGAPLVWSRWMGYRPDAVLRPRRVLRLRFPADVAAWWDIRCASVAGLSPGWFVAEHYPALTAPVSVASSLLAQLMGLPTEPMGDLAFRWRVAAGLASPFLDGGRQQAEANAGLDRPSTCTAAHRRRCIAAGPAQRTWRALPSIPRAAKARSASVGHVLRVARRWALAFVPALVRACALGRSAQ